MGGRVAWAGRCRREVGTSVPRPSPSRLGITAESTGAEARGYACDCSLRFEGKLTGPSESLLKVLFAGPRMVPRRSPVSLVSC
jgi:hypothetical protein